MVISLKTPSGMSSNPWIEYYLYSSIEWEKLPIHKYVSLRRMCFLLRTTQDVVMDMAAKSKVLHGVIINKRPIVFHPTGVEKAVKRYWSDFQRQQDKQASRLLQVSFQKM